MTDARKRWLADSAERAARTFLQAYFAVWITAGGGFDYLFTADNLKGGVVGVALSVAMSVGALKRGADDSASYLPADVDPPQDDGQSVVGVVVVVLVVLIALRVFGVI